MMRFAASLTHQSVLIQGTSFPDAKLQFPKLRGGTADSTLKFLLRLLEMVENEPKEEAVNEFRKKFSLANNGENGMEVDDANSMKVNNESRQNSAIP